MGFLDIFLVEALVNGLLLGGVLALLALGLNLIFGVIDVAWICYAELVMFGMYAMYYFAVVYGLGYWIAAQGAVLVFIAIVVAYGWAMNRFERQDQQQREALERSAPAAEDRAHG